jgi:hypothetical protein
MEVETTHFSFNRLSGSGPREARKDVTFSSPVAQATAVLTGFDVLFTREGDEPDHHLGNLEVRLDATIDNLAPQRVFVDATYGLRDWSEEWDDPYEGEIFVTVVAELEPTP